MLRSPLLLLVLTLLVSAPATAQFFPDTRVDLGDPNGASAAASPVVRVDGDLVRAAWSDFRDGSDHARAMFSASFDGGRSWLPQPIRTNPDGGKGVGGIAMAVQGNAVYLAYLDSRNAFPTGAGGVYNDIRFNRSTDGGATWGTLDQQLNHDFAGRIFVTAPRLAADGDDVYAVWSQSSIANPKVVFDVSRDRGVTWLNFDLDISGGVASSISWPRMAVSGDHVYVVWADRRNGDRDIFFNVSHDRGSTWKPSAIRLDVGDPPGASSAFCPEIAADGDWVYVAWSDRRHPNFNQDIYFNRSSDNGDSWMATDVRLDTGTPGGSDDSEFPFLAAGDGSVHVAWVQGNGTVVNSSYDHGATWLASETLLGAFGDYRWGPDLQRHGDDVYAITSSARFGGEPMLIHSFDDGQSWQGPEQLAPDGVLASGKMEFDADADGNVVAIWADDRDAVNGGADIYAAPGRYPWLALDGDPIPGQTVTFSVHEATEAGAVGQVLLSMSGETPGIFLPDGTGRKLDLQFDNYTAWSLANPASLTTAPMVNGSGTTPPLSVPLFLPSGLTIWAGAATFDSVSGSYPSVTRSISFIVP